MSDVLEFVSSIYPADIIIHVGEVTSSLRGMAIGRLDILSPLSEANSLGLLGVTNDNGIFRHRTLIGGANEYVEYFVANLAHESSTIEPGLLIEFWRNIREVSRSKIKTITLDDFLEDHPTWSSVLGARWLIVSCLPGSEILSGAETALANTDVLILRGFASQPDEAMLKTEASMSLINICEKAGFAIVGTVPERNSAFVRLIFVRNWKSQAKTISDRLRSDYEALAKQSRSREDELQSELKRVKQREQLCKDNLEHMRQKHNSDKALVKGLRSREDELQSELKRVKQREQLCKNNLEHMRQKHSSIADFLIDRDEKLAKLKTILSRIQKANEAASLTALLPTDQPNIPPAQKTVLPRTLKSK